MLEKTTRSLKLLVGAMLALLAFQTLALGAIYQELINIRVQMNVLAGTVTTIARNQP